MISLLVVSLVELNMERAVEIARQNSFQVEALDARREVLEGDYIKARSAFFPSLKLQGVYTYNANPAELNFPTRYIGYPNYQTPDPNDLIVVPDTTSLITIPLRPRHAFNFQATLQQPIFTWFREINAYRLARHQMEIHEVEREQTLLTVEYQVRSFYLELLGVRELLQLKKRTLEDMEEVFRSTSERYDKGLVSRLEYLQAKVELENARYDYENARKLYEDMKDNLKVFLNLPPDEEIRITDSLQSVAVDSSVVENADSLIMERYDIRLLQEQKKSLHYLLDIQKSATKPNIMAQANYTFSRPAPNLQSDWGSTWTVSLVGVWNAFDGFRNKGEVKKIEAQMDQLDLSIEFARRQARVELDRALRSLHIARENLKKMETNLSVAKEMFDSAKEQYERGLIPLIKFRDMQRAYIAARLGYDMALKDYKKSLLEVWRVVKIGGESNGR